MEYTTIKQLSNIATSSWWLCLENTDNVACPKWRASLAAYSGLTDGSVVKMAVALPHLRSDSPTWAELPLKHDQIRKCYPPVGIGVSRQHSFDTPLEQINQN